MSSTRNAVFRRFRGRLSGVCDASFGARVTAVAAINFQAEPSREFTPSAHEFVSSSALQSGQLGVTTTAPEGLILPSRADAWCTHTPKSRHSLGRATRATRPARRPLARGRLQPKKLRVAARPLCSREAKAALKSERTSGSLRKQTKASVSPRAALETWCQSLHAHTSLKLQTPLAASTTRVLCCDTSPFWRWPMPFTLQAGLLR